MKFLIISHAIHKTKDALIYSYAPYVREMNIWLKYLDQVEVLAPLDHEVTSIIEIAYQHDNLKLTSIPAIQFTSIIKIVQSLIRLPKISIRIFKACKKADHIHLRCPGNIGLIGCFVQFFFPKKQKTAKYAGNWDPNSKQPLSYKLQKWILSNTFLTKNMQVLVYGNWPNQTKNIKPFYTATYHNSEIEKPLQRNYSNELKFVFVGSLVNGKRPLLAIQIIKALQEQGKNLCLDIYGDGILKDQLQTYINTNNLEQTVILHGNQSKDVIKDALKQAHFSILPSISEGWPKAVAEAMFFGAIPIATKVSCVQDMLGLGTRGILIDGHLKADIKAIMDILEDYKALENMSIEAAAWSQRYTLNKFETDIAKLLQQS